MSEWINVKDRLPEDEQAVLMCHEDQSSSLPLIGWYEFIGKVPGFYMASTLEEIRVLITHWCPVPVIPKRKSS
jgi:Protein of unknown function (DUF551)